MMTTPATQALLPDLAAEIARKIARVHPSHHASAIPVTIKVSRTYAEMEKLVAALQAHSLPGDVGTALAGLEWSEDGYSLRTPFDGDVDGDGRHVVVGGETVITFADSDVGDEYRERILAALTPSPCPGDVGMLAVEKLLGFEVEGACPICGGIEECPHSLDERIAASRPKGTFECPICGEDNPHGHPPHEVERSLRNATLRLQAFAAASEARSIGIPYGEWASKAGYDSRDIQNALGVHCAADAFAADLRAMLVALTPSVLSGDAGEGKLPADVRRLVIAARTIAFNVDQESASADWETARRDLDAASEAFASRVPWEDE